MKERDTDLKEEWRSFMKVRNDFCPLDFNCSSATHTVLYTKESAL
jgi:hypothetical protein